MDDDDCSGEELLRGIWCDTTLLEEVATTRVVLAAEVDSDVERVMDAGQWELMAKTDLRAKNDDAI